MAKTTKTAQWEAAHPDDVPCPRPTGPGDYHARRAAREWRKARGIIVEPAIRKLGLDAAGTALGAAYEAAMAEKRAWQAKQEATDVVADDEQPGGGHQRNFWWPDDQAVPQSQ